jgi:hypothetical protein
MEKTWGFSIRAHGMDSGTNGASSGTNGPGRARMAAIPKMVKNENGARFWRS